VWTRSHASDAFTDKSERHLRDHLEWWDNSSSQLLEGPPPERTDAPDVTAALRVEFLGQYDNEEDDFTGQTYFVSPTLDDGSRSPFRTPDKRLCGFLFLRTLRTGSRALSLERGSLLDIILRLQEKRLHMWEDVLEQLRVLPVADKPELGVSETLSTVQAAVRTFVPSDWAENPHMRVSDLTREHLRRVLTVFMSTGATNQGGSQHAAPFQHQGTGTINTLVLALLSQIAELKQNVIFAMEEPEIALPPHAQRCIIDNVKSKSAQAIFTSHSPYVLEEFPPSHVLVVRRDTGTLTAIPATYPPAVKPKAYRTEFRARFCEALLARRVLIAEGRTEFDAFPVAARRLQDLAPAEFTSLEGLGIATIDAQTDSQLVQLGEHFTRLGKTVLAVFDRQSPDAKAAIEAAIPHAFESPEAGFEDVLVNGVAEPALRRFVSALVANGNWPPHLAATTPTDTTSLEDLKAALRAYLKWAKGAGGAADLLAACNVDEMPPYVVNTLRAIRATVSPPVSSAPGSTETPVEA